MKFYQTISGSQTSGVSKSKKSTLWTLHVYEKPIFVNGDKGLSVKLIEVIL